MIELKREEQQAIIAKNIALLLEELCETSLVVNLGVGLPLQVVNHLHNDHIYIHTENGLVGVGPLAFGDDVDPDLINAGRQPVTETVGCAYTDIVESFGMIRGGHLDAVVLGAFQVDEQANVANWIIPGTTLLGVGGAMDLAVGANRVILAMTHTNAGEPKLVKRCTLPITGCHEADYVVTEYAMFRFGEAGPVLEKIHPGVTVDEVRSLTGFEFAVADGLSPMTLCP